MTDRPSWNISSLITARAARAPQAPAIVDASGVVADWATLADRLARVAGALQAQGLVRGDRVALLAPNGPGFFETLFGIVHAGLIAVPLNFRLHPDELAFQVADSGARLWLAHETLADAVRAAPADTETVIFGERGLDAWSEKVAHTAPPAAAPAARDDVAGIFYTGGTTGRPKGVQLMHGNLLANAENIAPRFGYRPDDIYLHAAPMFHLADLGATMAQLRVGGAHAFLPAFSPAGLARAVAAVGATVTTLAPTMVDMLLRDPDVDDADLATLRLVLYGGGPIGETVLNRALTRLDCDWLQGYGQTEATHTVCYLGADEHRRAATAPGRLRSCGKPVAGVDVQLGDDDGRPVPPGEVGEVQVRGGTVMKGYWQRPEETRAAFVAGWLKTGDLGWQDADGYIYLVDRKKDMIVTGGENVYSAEVENVLAGCPGVVEAAVIGVPDDKWGERVHAVVAAASGAALGVDAIQRHCRAHLAGYKMPRSVEFVDALPKTAAGKIAKAALRRPYWEGRDRNVG